MNAETSEAISKRDRQRQRRRARAETQKRHARRQRRQRLARNVGLAVLALVVVVGLAFWLGSGGTDVTLGVAEAQVEGDEEPLPPLDPAGADPAVGQPAPTVAGETPAGEALTIGAGAGQAQALTFMAHWCPHCQDEVPEVVDWVADGALPDDVELVAVSSRHDPARPNWPPDEWLAGEDWPGSVLVDATDAAAEAYGLTATPFWVFVDADGEVVARVSGRITRAQFEEATAAMSSD